jgi:hypothetical protein
LSSFEDIVFLIYLYQRWIYPVDKSRVETFGDDGDVVEVETTTTSNNTNSTQTENNNNNKKND